MNRIFFYFLFVLVCCSCIDQKREVYNGSIDQLEELLKADSIRFDRWYELGKAYENKGNKKKAFHAYNQSLKKDSMNCPLLIHLADLYLEQVELLNTQTLLKKALKVDSVATEPRLKLGQLSIYKGDYNAAFSYINSALKIDVAIPQAYFMKGVCYKHLKDTIKSLSSFRTAVELNPEYYDAFIELGLLSTLVNDSNGIQYFKNAVELNSKSSEAIYGLAWSYQMFHDIDKAKKLYKEVLLINQNEWDAYFNLGDLYCEENKIDSAILSFKELIKTPSHRKDANYRLSKCYRLLGRVKLADEYLELSLKDEDY
jgi:tetratricopeptide (TPR) repeat protein